MPTLIRSVFNIQIILIEDRKITEIASQEMSILSKTECREFTRHIQHVLCTCS